MSLHLPNHPPPLMCLASCLSLHKKVCSKGLQTLGLSSALGTEVYLASDLLKTVTNAISKREVILRVGALHLIDQQGSHCLCTKACLSVNYANPAVPTRQAA